MWIMINVSPEYCGGPIYQGDAHLLLDQTGKAVLIDTGDYDHASRALIPFLKSNGITKLDSVLVSHPHIDHYGGLLVLLEGPVSIGSIYMVVPPVDVCNNDGGGDVCFYDQLQTILDGAQSKGIPVVEDLDEYQPTTWLGGQTLSTVESGSCPAELGQCSLNDMSWLLRLESGPTRALFTGDLGAAKSDWLVQNGFDLAADILKVPHHGAEGNATNAFYAAVHPAVAMVPTPSLLWYGNYAGADCNGPGDPPKQFYDRCGRVREQLLKLQSRVFVNGMLGAVVVRLHPDGRYTITPGDCPDPMGPGCAPLTPAP